MRGAGKKSKQLDASIARDKLPLAPIPSPHEYMGRGERNRSLYVVFVVADRPGHAVRDLSPQATIAQSHHLRWLQLLQ